MASNRSARCGNWPINLPRTWNEPNRRWNAVKYKRITSIETRRLLSGNGKTQDRTPPPHCLNQFGCQYELGTGTAIEVDNEERERLRWRKTGARKDREERSRHPTQKDYGWPPGRITEVEPVVRTRKTSLSVNRSRCKTSSDMLMKNGTWEITNLSQQRNKRTNKQIRKTRQHG